MLKNKNFDFKRLQWGLSLKDNKVESPPLEINKIVCFGCDQLRHLVKDCKSLKQKVEKEKFKGKGKKVMIAAWSDSDSRESEDE